MPSPPQLVALARKAAAAQSLDPALVCAVIEQESSWNIWAMRYEPAFFAKYVAHLYTNNKVTASEAYARGFSWGLMQVMGLVAREMGFDGTFRRDKKLMTSRIWLRLAEILVPALLAITLLVAWQADRRDRAQLANQLAAAQKTISEASASQHDRDTLLNQTLAQIQAQKQAVVTPAQILKSLPASLSLPAPIMLQSQAQPTTTAPSLASQANGSTEKATHSTRIPSTPTPKSGQAPDAILPAADLKPLYDFALDCKACQAKLAAAQSDLNDEKTKTVALAKERDDAVRTAKGGSALRRIARAAKWFVLGAAAGAIAAKAVH